MFLMPNPETISIKDFDYELPADKIAQFPLAERDASKLLVYSQGRISQDIFSNIDAYLPANSLLVFNNTRVIRARLIFRKQTGSRVEIFCLEPIAPVREIQAAFQQQSASKWKCLVGNLKRWKSGSLVLESTLHGQVYQLFAEHTGDCGDGSHEISFRWNPPGKRFSEILEIMGLIPLPPYINRPSELLDNERYQTIYADHDGSVAAPTAGLHFTDSVLTRLISKGVEVEKVTLHVGVGTFRPVVAEQIGSHVMHHEKIVVRADVIEHLLNNPGRPVFAVGTTSARTMESLYWLGARLIREGPACLPLVTQWEPYQANGTGTITTAQSLEALLDFLQKNHLEEYSGETRLMIAPGYRYRLLSGLITNFHMPQSTLLLLVAALIGGNWKDAYDYALSNGFRFLSYGDSCLFFNPVTELH